MAKQNERQRPADDPRDAGIGDEERIRGVEDIGGLPEDAEDEDDFERAVPHAGAASVQQLRGAAADRSGPEGFLYPSSEKVGYSKLWSAENASPSLNPSEVISNCRIRGSCSLARVLSTVIARFTCDSPRRNCRSTTLSER